jgi:outer membrane lipoprotein-sorting protein
MKSLSLAAFVLAAPVLAAQKAPSAELLAQMDAGSRQFHSMQAEVSYDNYLRAARADDIQTGSIYIERSEKGTQMGTVLYDAGSKTPSKVLSYDNGVFQNYSPGTNQVDVFKSGGNQAKYEGFLALGFGGSSKALLTDWNVDDQGPETVGGVKTEKLDLTSKPGVQSTYTHITIWLDPARDVSVKQVSFASNGDKHTATYSNIRLNGKIDRKPFAISGKATRIQH